MSSPEHIDERDEMLVAEYVLGTLPHGERVAFEQRLATEQTLQERVAWWNQQFVPLSDDIAPVQPSENVFASIERRLFDATAPKQSWWENLNFWRGLSVASLAGMLVIGVLYANQRATLSIQPSDEYIAQIAGEASDVQLVALYDEATKTLKLNRTSGSSAIGRDFELWVIAGGNAPVSLGVLPTDESFEVLIPQELQSALVSDAVLAVSDEPSGGSPTGQPTGAVLATGQIFPI